MGKPRVYVCAGGSCRKPRKGFRKLLSALQGEARVERVKCQKICDGPVAGMSVGGCIVWFGELDSRKRRDALLELVQTGRLPSRLEKRCVPKRSGKLRA